MPKWQQAYTDLTRFITRHPEIEIKLNFTRIPEEVRPEFYILFDRARQAYIEDYYPNLLSESRALSANYMAAEARVKAQLNLEEIELRKPLDVFVADPAAGLQMSLFHPLFDRLKGKLDGPALDKTAQYNVTGDFRALFSQGYEKWLALSLISLLSADQLFQVYFRDVLRNEVMEIETPGANEDAPAPVQVQMISFRHMGYQLFSVPDLIIHSKLLGRYLSLRTAIDKPIAVASNRSENREWIPYDTIAAAAPGFIPVYLADSPDELSIVADRENFCRPDLLIECKSHPDWQAFENLDVIKHHHEVLRPRLGTVIVVREPAAEPVFNVLGENVYLLKLGFEASRLEHIIHLLNK